MRRALLLPLLAWLLAPGHAESGPLAISHVTVIDGTGAPAQPDRTVIVTGNRINRIGPAGTVTIPEGAQVVNAAGKFLIPGLWDMHVHWYDKDALTLFLANGVTGVRQMWGFPLHLEWRREFAHGTLLGPRMAVGGPIVDGPKPIWLGSLCVAGEADGQQSVSSIQAQGYDFVKGYNLIPRDAYFGIAAQARKLGIPFTGHVPLAVSAAEASDAGQKSIEHLDGLLFACSSQEDALRKEFLLPLDRPGLYDRTLYWRIREKALDSYDQKKAASLFARFVKNRTWQVPTLTVLRAIAYLDDSSFTTDARLKYMPPSIRTMWDPKNDFRFRTSTKEDFAKQKKLYLRNLQLVKDMHRAVVPFLAGTDVLNPYCFPGFSLHDELELLVSQCSFTPLEALQAATRSPAEYLDQLKDLGTVEVGKLADVVLLDANPLDDIRNTRKINAVVINGKLLPQIVLREMLEKVEASCKQQEVAAKAAPAASQPSRWTPELMLQVKEIPSVVPSPDGKRVAYTVRQAVMTGDKSEYLTQIHLVNRDGSEPFQLTQGEHSSEDPQWSPDGNTIAFVSDRSGKKNVWLIDVRGGEAWQLTDVKTSIGSFKWSPDGQSLGYTAADAETPEEVKAEREKTKVRVVDEQFKLTRLYVIPVGKDREGKRQARPLTTGACNVGNYMDQEPFDWSPDSKGIAFTHTPTPKVDDWPRGDISVVDVASGILRPLATSGAAEISPHYSPDGRWIAYLKSDEPVTWGPSMTIQVVPATGGAPRELAATFDHWPTLIGWSADSQKIYYTEARGTINELCALPLDGKPIVLSHQQGVMGGEPGGVFLNTTRTMAGFNYQTTSTPVEAFVSRLDQFAPVRVSSVNEELPELPLGRTEVRHWKSSDGRVIEGLLTLPPLYQSGKRYPLLLVIHGGPQDVFRQTFLAAPDYYLPYPLAVLAAKGFAVLRCNPRGSAGYGKDFRYANYKDWGGGDYRDLMAAVDEMIRLGVAAPDRLGVMGWSYGGYLSSWIITQTKRFRAASVGAGVTNLMSLTGTTDLRGILPDYFGAEPWDAFETYRKHSPMSHMKGVTTPTLIQHGEKDDRVPITQAYELYNALKRQGCAVKMMVYPRMPHVAGEPKQKLDLMQQNVAWFDKYLGSDKGKSKKEEATSTTRPPEAATPDELWAAARKGDDKAVTALLARGVAVNASTRYGATALWFAAYKGHRDAVKVLVKHGADANVRDKVWGMTPLTMAVEDGNPEIVEVLLEAGAGDGAAAFLDAVQQGKTDIVHVALAKAQLSPEVLGAALLTAPAKPPGIRDVLQKAGAKPLGTDRAVARGDDLTSYVGDYESPNGARVTALIREGRLLTQAGPGGAYILKAVGPGLFQAIGLATNLEFQRQDGRVARLSVKQPGLEPALFLRSQPRNDQKPHLEAAADSLAVTTPQNWPSFRGPNASGVADGQHPLRGGTSTTEGRGCGKRPSLASGIPRL
jgi:dipeptidyl aminopeptidase/acylaminoacyl peptidase/imidazolonepropionase-like amidohydrolase